MVKEIKLLDLWKALKNETRLDIYTLALKEKLNIQQISNRLKFNYPRTLRQVNMLVKFGIVKKQKEITKVAFESFIIPTRFEEGSTEQEVYLTLLQEIKFEDKKE